MPTPQPTLVMGLGISPLADDKWGAAISCPLFCRLRCSKAVARETAGRVALLSDVTLAPRARHTHCVARGFERAAPCDSSIVKLSC